MTAPVSDAAEHAAQRFRAAIVRRLGLQFEDTKLGYLDDLFRQRLGRLGHSSDAYLWSLENEPAEEEIAVLARELTVGETYFFRNAQQFAALREFVVPRRVQAAGAVRILRLLSAGCSSGEEPYTLAMVLRDALPDPGWEVSIRAIDLNPAALERAAGGIYSPWALRETSPEIVGRWFRPEGRDMRLDETVRRAVRFDRRNLMAEDAELWRPGSYDVIFCRNVIMYFSQEQQRAVLARIARALAPGGFLFLGHAETLRGLSDAFHLHQSHGTFFYERKGGELPFSLPLRSAQPPAAPVFTAPASGVEWYEAIGRASARVAELAQPGRADVRRPVEPAPASADSAAWDTGHVLELLRRESFAEALAYVRGLPSGRERDPNILLLEGILSLQGGKPDAAEEACRRLLALDAGNAGAHYVLALCREAAGDRIGAVGHDRAAAQLDPAFAMPRLHLGLLARRDGDVATARSELGRALLLLEREDDARLLLFGGGFGREALTALCRTALRAAGGAA